jgi:chromate transporter
LTWKIALLLELFIRFLKIGAVGFGGGWAILPIIEAEVVDDAKWLTHDEYSDLVAIAGSTPGPVAVNAATYVGFKLAGPVGAAVATLGVILPPFTAISLIVYGLSQFMGSKYVQAVLNGLKGAVLGLITLALFSMVVDVKGSMKGTPQLAGIAAIAVFTLVSVLALKVHPIIPLLASAAVGLILGLVGFW